MEDDDTVKSFVAYAVRCLSPQYISPSMLKRAKHSLNEISHEAPITLIKDAFVAGINIVEVKVDTVGPKGTYKAKLEMIFPGISITVEEKADSKFPIVSAASIAAKIPTRFLPTAVDPVFGFPSLVRFSWKTADVIIDKQCVKGKWEDDEDKNSQKMSHWLSNNKENIPPKRHTYFTDRGICYISEF